MKEFNDYIDSIRFLKKDSNNYYYFIHNNISLKFIINATNTVIRIFIEDKKQYFLYKEDFNDKENIDVEIIAFLNIVKSNYNYYLLSSQLKNKDSLNNIKNKKIVNV